MKNQYFGDDRDLFKYDLITTIIDEVPPLRQFTFIPLLTPNDSTGEGNVVSRRKGTPGSGNELLVKHLDASREAENPGITQIRDYFRNVGIPVYIHKADSFLSHKDREGYFEGLKDEELEDSLVFLDPDNGLEVMRSCEKQVLVDELHDIYERMGQGSVLMFFQYRPRLTQRAELVMEIATRLHGRGMGVPLVISESDVTFILFAKDPRTRKSVAIAIAFYVQRYPQLRIWNI